MARKTFGAELAGVIDAYDEPEAVQEEQEPEQEPERRAKQHPNAGKLQPEYTRYTIIISKEELDQLKGYAWYTQRKIKDIFAEMIDEFLKNHADELPKRGE